MAKAAGFSETVAATYHDLPQTPPVIVVVNIMRTSDLTDISWFLDLPRGLWVRLADDDVSELFVGSIFKGQL